MPGPEELPALVKDAQDALTRLDWLASCLRDAGEEDAARAVLAAADALAQYLEGQERVARRDKTI